MSQGDGVGLRGPAITAVVGRRPGTTGAVAGCHGGPRPRWWWRVVSLLVGLGATAAGPAAWAAGVPSLCLASETTLFSCLMGRHMASVCASTVLNEREGHVQYRFGSPGQVQLRFPAEKTHPSKVFMLDHSFAGKWAVTQLGFAVGDHTYVVHEYVNVNLGLDEEESGVLIHTPDGQRRNLNCGRTHSRVGLQALLPLGLPALPERWRY